MWFERRYPKQNTVIRQKSKIFPSQHFGLATLLIDAIAPVNPKKVT